LLHISVCEFRFEKRRSRWRVYPFLEGRARIVCAGGGIAVLPSSAIMQIEDGFVSTQCAYSGVKKLRDKDMGFHGRIRAFCLRLNVNISTLNLAHSKLRRAQML
jgi:hypothetical protein